MCVHNTALNSYGNLPSRQSSQLRWRLS